MAGKVRTREPHGAAQVPEVKTVPKPTHWTFSFRFWTQKEFFGVPDDARWYVSVLNRLHDLSGFPLEQLQERDVTEALRYHEIDWTTRAIPVQRRDFGSVAADYLTNETEYPFVQVHISKAVGRIVGFWDERKVFNVVVLDPHHNLQPSGKVGYKVTDTRSLDCQFTSILRSVEKVQALPCENQKCELRTGVHELPNHHEAHEVLVFQFREGALDDAERLIADGKASSMSDIFETGIAHLL
jgi:hypothetical protein